MVPGVTGPDNDQDQTTTTLFGCSLVLGGHCLVLKILGPHNNVGKIVRSLSGPETPGRRPVKEDERESGSRREQESG